MLPNSSQITELQVRQGAKLHLPDASNLLAVECERVNDPRSQAFDMFYDLMGREFGDDELEPKPDLAREVAEGICICVVAKVVASAAYGSVLVNQESDEAFLAIRFTTTEKPCRGSGISQIADEQLVKIANQESSKLGKNLSYLICEGVKDSENYWNQMKIDQQSPGMRRIFTPDNREIFYRLPPLAWNEDGTPAAEGAREHLMISGEGTVSVEHLINTLRPWWESWYIRPASKFESLEAFELHKKTVHSILEDQIIKPLRQYQELRLLSKSERQAENILCYDEIPSFRT